MSCVILNKSKLSSKEVVEKLFNSGEIIEEKGKKINLFLLIIGFKG